MFGVANEEGNLDAEGFEEFGEGFGVLRGEDGGGGEEGDLVAGFDGGEGGECGDHGFAGADVALEKAVHGGGFFEVFEDFESGEALGVFGWLVC